MAALPTTSRSKKSHRCGGFLPKSFATCWEDWCGSINLGLGCGGRSENMVRRRWVSATLESKPEKVPSLLDEDDGRKFS
ncbi:hypothetical protein ACFX12_046257 [Malus domestica]